MEVNLKEKSSLLRIAEPSSGTMVLLPFVVAESSNRLSKLCSGDYKGVLNTIA